MSERTDPESETGRGTNRRHVLQGIGAAGVAGAVMTGSAGAASGGLGRAQANVALQEEQEEIPISTQFWSYRNDVLDTDMTTAELVQEAADAGYDAFEPFRVGLDTDAQPILDAMEGSDIEMSSAHASLDDALNSPDETAEYFSQFGEPILIHAFEGEETWQSEDSILEFAQTINEAADLMAERDLPGFGYHNHDHEFVEVDGADELGFDIFAQEVNDNVHLQIDAGWVLVGGADPISYTIEYADKVGSIHMKNMTADGEFTEIHEGDVNMRAVATAARNAADVDYLIFEHDEPENPLESMDIGAEWLDRLNQPWNPGGLCTIPDADTHPAILHEPDEEDVEEGEDGETENGDDEEAENGDEEETENGDDTEDGNETEEDEMEGGNETEGGNQTETGNETERGNETEDENATDE